MSTVSFSSHVLGPFSTTLSGASWNTASMTTGHTGIYGKGA